NEARVLAHPASVDNVTTSGGKEDHVSMGMTSALKLRSIVDLAENLFAIELLTGAEALEHRRPLRAGKGVEGALKFVREVAAPRAAGKRSMRLFARSANWKTMSRCWFNLANQSENFERTTKRRVF